MSSSGPSGVSFNTKVCVSVLKFPKITPQIYLSNLKSQEPSLSLSPKTKTVVVERRIFSCQLDFCPLIDLSTPLDSHERLQEVAQGAQILNMTLATSWALWTSSLNSVSTVVFKSPCGQRVNERSPNYCGGAKKTCKIAGLGQRPAENGTVKFGYKFLFWQYMVTRL